MSLSLVRAFGCLFNAQNRYSTCIASDTMQFINFEFADDYGRMCSYDNLVICLNRIGVRLLVQFSGF